MALCSVPQALGLAFGPSYWVDGGVPPPLALPLPRSGYQGHGKMIPCCPQGPHEANDEAE